MKVYLLEHLMIYHDYEDTKFIGVFSSKDKALEAIRILSTKNGFKKAKIIINPLEDDNKSGFVIDEWEIDKITWKEGFGW